MINLNTYGWNDKLSQLKQESAYRTLFHGRVTIVNRTCYEVISENGLFQCELTGNMMFGKSDYELPCVGDWVIFQSFDESKGSDVLIDTPGVREFGLTIDDADSIAEMLDISDYAELCRFKDCEHINEPDCAVLEAVNNGTLDRKVYESYLKLKREAWHFSSSEHEKREKDKSFSKLIDEVKKHQANF
ncbi:MAG: hypothetical protein EOL95_07930 [Bacteroidia bacterium]|nr:hypothetical protein [Bacteroidia bacterium]